MATSNPNWFPGNNPPSQRAQTAPAGQRRPSPPRSQSQSLTETNSATTTSASPPKDDGKTYIPPLAEWKKAGKPPEKAFWTDSSGRAAAWRCRAVDPRRPQVRGWARNKGDLNPNNHRAWLDASIVDKVDKKWVDYPPLPDLKVIEEERRKKKAEKEEKKKEKENKKEFKKKRKEKEDDRMVKLPWWMKAMGLKVLKVEDGK